MKKMTMAMTMAATTRARVLATFVFAVLAVPSLAAGWAQPAEGDRVVRDFRFHDGTVLPESKLHHTTLGAPRGEPVVVPHGTGRSGATMLAAPFAGALFGAGQPLDLARDFVILPDAIGHGKSSMPSDGMHARFPHYDDDDMVEAQYRLPTEHLGLRHLRLVLGHSMGGMETWLLAQKYPGFMGVVVPMASMPIPMSGRDWMMRRLIVDSIRTDSDGKVGEYTVQPKGARLASTFFDIAMSGGTRALQRAAPTAAKADALVDQRLAAAASQDANDMPYQWDSSRDFDPSPGLERIRSTLVAIDSVDDDAIHPSSGSSSARSGACRTGA